MYYYLPLGYTDDGFQESYEFELSSLQIANENDCKQLFFQESQQRYKGDFKNYAPKNIDEIELCTLSVAIEIISFQPVVLVLKIVKDQKSNINVQSFNYATSGGLHSGFSVVLLPKPMSFPAVILV